MKRWQFELTREIMKKKVNMAMVSEKKNLKFKKQSLE
jgi:hypothetical protein